MTIRLNLIERLKETFVESWQVHLMDLASTWCDLRRYDVINGATYHGSHTISRCRTKSCTQTASALTQLIAGSDTTSNSSCAIVWWVTKHPSVHAKLQRELDSKLGHVDGFVEHEDCKDLPYLNACINEALRRHSTSSIGLPRIMVEDTEYKGRLLKKGTVVSVPSYEIHHNEKVYGDP